MEVWKEIFKNIIPSDKYDASIINSNVDGLKVMLTNDVYNIKLDFGIVSAVRMIDEGILLNGVYAEAQIEKYKKNNFSNVIYKICDGEFANFIKNSSGGLYEYLGMQHYIIVTLNSLIEVISQWKPSIEVNIRSES